MSHHKKRVYPQQAFPQQQPQPLFQGQGSLNDGPVSNPNSAPGSTNPGNVRVFTPAEQQITQTFSNMNISSPTISQRPVVTTPQNTGFQHANQLYPVDLLAELPPPINDLELPPPPILIRPEQMIVPSEQANASPDYIRSTFNCIPYSSSVLKKSRLPLALVIRPYQHLNDNIDPPPLTKDHLIVRCRRCRVYLNPFVKFVDNGRRWRCNFCRLTNDLPAAIDQNLLNDTPTNRYERNELRFSTMEYLAPKEYSVRKPPPSVYCFLLDVSQNAIKNGLLNNSVRVLLEKLNDIPNHDNDTHISILCVDSAIHYISIPEDSQENNQVQLLDIFDLDEPFSPLPNNLLVSLTNCKKNIENILLKIPEIFNSTVVNKFALGSGLRAAAHLIRSIGGKIIVISATLPNEGIGKLTRRSEKNVSNTSKETSQLLTTQDPFYKSFTIECSKSQITVDSFLASNDYIDVASITNLSRFTGGQTHFYPGFSSDSISDITKFSNEFGRHITMDLSMETVMRCRGSLGLRSNGFYGHFFNRSSDLCAFSTMPRDQDYIFEINIDDHVIERTAFFQVAVLLSLNTGERRIRVITLALPTSESLIEVFASVDQKALFAYYARKAAVKALNTSMDDARDVLRNAVQDVLSVYKRDMVVSNTAGGLPLRLCANMRMFPLLIHSLLKHIAFRAAIVPSDHRSAALNYIESIPLPYLIKYVYPDVYSLHDMEEEIGLPNGEEQENGSILLPQRMNASATLMEKYGLYLIDNGQELFLWIGGDAVPELIQDVFGMNDIFQLPIGKHELPILENSIFNTRIRNIITALRSRDDTIKYQTLYIVRGQSISEPVNIPNARELASFRMWVASELVEDKLATIESYREFLQNMKSKISK